MIKHVETSSNAATLNDNEVVARLHHQVTELNKTVVLLERDLEHISYLCSTAGYYLKPGKDGILLDGDELRNIIHLIGIIVCESDMYGCD